MIVCNGGTRNLRSLGGNNEPVLEETSRGRDELESLLARDSIFGINSGAIRFNIYALVLAVYRTLSLVRT